MSPLKKPIPSSGYGACGCAHISCKESTGVSLFASSSTSNLSANSASVSAPNRNDQPCSAKKVFVLRFLQGRNPDWVQRPFFAKYSDTATWLHELEPAFGEEKFFFEDEYEQMRKGNG